MKELLLDIILKNNIISYKRLLEKYPGTEEDLSIDLKQLLNNNIISKKVVVLCPRCSIIIGYKDELEKNKTGKCESCDYEVDLIDQNFEVFF